MKIQRTFKSSDPFAQLRHPRGATGLLLSIDLYWFAKDKYSYYYVLRNVKQSMDYTSQSGESMCGVTPSFTDTYWRLKTKAEARFLVMRLLSGKNKRHYETMFDIVDM